MDSEVIAAIFWNIGDKECKSKIMIHLLPHPQQLRKIHANNFSILSHNFVHFFEPRQETLSLNLPKKDLHSLSLKSKKGANTTALLGRSFLCKTKLTIQRCLPFKSNFYLLLFAFKTFLIISPVIFSNSSKLST